VVQRICELTIVTGVQPIITGTVQIDESFVGGKEKGKHASKKAKGAQGSGSYKPKAAVMCMISDSGELRVEKINSGDVKTVKSHVRKHVATGSNVNTNEPVNYVWIQDYYRNEAVNHRLGEYVRGSVTTNAIEGAFGHFKRVVHGVYHKASDQHIDR
jgi:ISXO2-like transposase domain